MTVSSRDAAASGDAVASRPTVEISFEENRGQPGAAPSALFFWRGSDHHLRFERGALAISQPGDDAKPPKRLRIVPVGGDPQALPRAWKETERAQRSHYLLGGRERWVRDVRHYGRIQYDDVYPGIGLVYYTSGGRLEYDFVVAPGVDPSRIRLAFEGANRIALGTDGEVLVHVGGERIRQRPPIAYQLRDGVRERVACRHVIHDDEVAFELASYDTTRQLVIDPILLYSGLLENTGIAAARDLARDVAGFAYVTGQVEISDELGDIIPLRPLDDAFVRKFDPSDGSIVYMTYFGGSDGDAGRGIAVDAQGRATVVGETLSADFTTLNAVQSDLAGDLDAFAVQLNAAGDDFLWSTYLGGSLRDTAEEVVLDSAGQPILFGNTYSPDLPTTNALQPDFGGGMDAFLAKFDATGSSLLYLTYLGGSGDDNPVGTTASMVLDSSDNLYVSGTTESLDFPVSNAIQPDHRLGGRDAFLTGIDASGSTLLFSTFLGGGGGDGARALALGVDGSIYLAGVTRSHDFPIVGGVQRTKGLLYDTFITKLSPDAQQIVYSTYLGGSAPDGIAKIRVDAAGNVYAVGFSDSDDFPQVDAFQGFAGNFDAIAFKLTPSGDAIAFSSYLGGSGPDLQVGNLHLENGIVLHDDGTVTIVGTTTSPDFPLVNATRPPVPYFTAFVATIGSTPEVELHIANDGQRLSLSADIANTTAMPIDVELRIWAALPSGPVAIEGPSGARTVAAQTTDSTASRFVDDYFETPGARIHAKITDVVTGRTIAEAICTASPCN